MADYHTREAAAQKILAEGIANILSDRFACLRLARTRFRLNLGLDIKYMMKKKTQHDEYCDAIIKSIQSINPHTNQEGRVGYIYSSGFLASYLASLMVEDPWAYKKFKQHIDSLGLKHKP